MVSQAMVLFARDTAGSGAEPLGWTLSVTMFANGRQFSASYGYFGRTAGIDPASQLATARMARASGREGFFTL